MAKISRGKLGATPGSKKLPSLKEDVRKGVKEDADRLRKPMSSTAKGAAKTAVVGAAKRAGMRMAGRAAGIAGAAIVGKEIGDAIVGATRKKTLSRTPSGRAESIPGQTKWKPKVAGKIQNKTGARQSKTQAAGEFARSGGVFKGSTGEAKRKKR
jgi:hypothetical protein